MPGAQVVIDANRRDRLFYAGMSLIAFAALLSRFFFSRTSFVRAFLVCAIVAVQLLIFRLLLGSKNWSVRTNSRLSPILLFALSTAVADTIIEYVVFGSPADTPSICLSLFVYLVVNTSCGLFLVTLMLRPQPQSIEHKFERNVLAGKAGNGSTGRHGSDVSGSPESFAKTTLEANAPYEAGISKALTKALDESRGTGRNVSSYLGRTPGVRSVVTLPSDTGYLVQLDVQNKWVRVQRVVGVSEPSHIELCWIRGDLYGLYGLSPNSSPNVVAKAHQHLLREHSERVIQEILLNAFEILTTLSRRQLYLIAQQIMGRLRRKLDVVQYELKQCDLWQDLWSDLNKRFPYEAAKVTTEVEEEIVKRLIARHIAARSTRAGLQGPQLKTPSSPP